MPLVAHSTLPTFERLRDEGQEVLDPARALKQDIRELHVGLLNMMPDAAIEATERQFMRLVGSCNRIAQFHVHPFTLPGVKRGEEAQIHVDTHYEDFARLRRTGLDALIITGANPVEADITRETFWDGLMEVVAWARDNTCSVLCSCLASHAVWKQHHRIERTPLREKLWGVFSHRITAPEHPLLNAVNTRFDAPHSRWNDVPRARLEACGMKVLVEGKQAGVLMAVSPDLFRFVYFQGHPEYDIASLLKEYKREVMRFQRGELTDFPGHPENYFSPTAVSVLASYEQQVLAAKHAGDAFAEFPEALVHPHLDNTWTDTGKAIFNNWLGLVYQLTHRERNKVFMKHVDPRDPLGLRKDLASTT